VTDDGFTRVDASGCIARCATRWRDLDGFEAMLVDRLTRPQAGHS